MSAALPVRVTLALGVLAALTAGCSKHETAPTAPPVAVAPVLQVSPPERSIRVPTESDVVVDFAVDVDESTLLATTLFLKVDTRRFAYTFDWSASARRLTIHPTGGLVVGRTYTVEFTDRVRKTDGTSVFPAGWKFQFTTLSIRPFRTPMPEDGATWQSKFIRLRWDETEPEAGLVTYTLFVSTDSALVATRAAPSVGLTGGRWIPTTAWAMGRTSYWSIRGANLRTGEVLEGPVWSFRTVPVDAPQDSSRVLPTLEWASTSASLLRCNYIDLTVSPSTNNFIQWRTEAVPNDLRIARVDFVIAGNPAYTTGTAISLRESDRPLDACAILYPGPPYPKPGVLATASAGGQGLYLFRGDALSARLEATLRDGDGNGYMFVGGPTTTVSFTIRDPGLPGLGALRVVTYLPPPGARP